MNSKSLYFGLALGFLKFIMEDISLWFCRVIKFVECSIVDLGLLVIMKSIIVLDVFYMPSIILFSILVGRFIID